MIKINKAKCAPGKITCPDDYRKGPVAEQIRKDFHGKCYLCENGIQSGHVDHLVPHKGDPELMYDWRNLFLSCSRCNTIKGARFDDIIDCTDVDPEEYIEFSYDAFPMVRPKFQLIQEDGEHSEQAKRTIILLEEIFCVPPSKKATNEKAIKRANDQMKRAIKLYEDLYVDVSDLKDKIAEYFSAVEEDVKQECYAMVAKRIRRSAHFAAFKRKIIKDKYFSKFGDELRE